MPLDVSDMRARTPTRRSSTRRRWSPLAAAPELFAAIYHGKKAIKTVPELAEKLGLSQKQVLDAGIKLVANQIVEQDRVDGRVAYKDPAITPHKQKILDLVDDPRKKDRYPTKQEPRASGQAVIHRISVQRSNPQPKGITIDEIEAFAAVKGAAPTAADLGNLLEEDVKQFLHRILGEMELSNDWGGEKNDIYTSRLQFRGTRRTRPSR